jgi:hypothetical protein
MIVELAFMRPVLVAATKQHHQLLSIFLLCGGQRQMFLAIRNELVHVRPRVFSISPSGGVLARRSRPLFSNLGAFTGVVDPRGGFAFPSASPGSIVSSSASSRTLTGGAMTLATTRTRA